MQASLTPRLLHHATFGLPGFVGALPLVASWRADADLPHDEARLAALVRHELRKSFAAGFCSNLGGLLTLPWALPGGLLASWLLQLRLATSIAALRAYDVEDPLTRAQILATLAGPRAQALLRHSGAGIAQAARQVLPPAAREAVLRQVGKQLGPRLWRRGLSGSARRWLPLAGAAVGGGADWWAARQTAQAALRLFTLPRRLPSHV